MSFWTFFKNIIISPKCLITQCIFVFTKGTFCCTISYTKHKPDFKI